MTSGVLGSMQVLRLPLCAALVLSLAVAAGCGDDGDDDDREADGGSQDGGGDGAADAGEASGDAAAADAGAAIAELNGCTAAMYIDKSAVDATRTITNQGVTYTPKCMIIAKGQKVKWNVSMTVHPLAPGNAASATAGTPDSPIVSTASGDSVEFTFEDEGTFPYHCTVHSSGAGVGMAGSIHVQ